MLAGFGGRSHSLFVLGGTLVSSAPEKEVHVVVGLGVGLGQEPSCK